jgi:hypothetical protein
MHRVVADASHDSCSAAVRTGERAPAPVASEYSAEGARIHCREGRQARPMTANLSSTRRVHVVGSTPHPDHAFMAQAARSLTDAVAGFLVGYRAPICDRDTKWTAGFRRILEGAGVRVVQTPIQAPNANAYAERFVRSIREECLNRLIVFGEGPLRHVVGDFVAYDHAERNHQGLSNEIDRAPMGPDRRPAPLLLRTARRPPALLPSRSVGRTQFSGTTASGLMLDAEFDAVLDQLRDDAARDDFVRDVVL